MSLAEFSLKRPIAVIMFFAGVILLGVISFSRLQQELLPPITYPQISVVTFYKDAAPEEIEMLVTKPIEEAVGTVGGLKSMSSVSREEVSLVIGEFDWGINVDMAGLSVREKIDLIKEKLPRGSSEPIVVKYNPFKFPVIILNVTGKRPPEDLLSIAKKQIKNELEKIDGVASCDIRGGREKEILVEVDQARLFASGVSILEVAEALKKTNLNYPAGTLEEKFYEQLLRTIGEFEKVAEIENVPISFAEEEQQKERQAQELKGETAYYKKPPVVKNYILLKDVAKVKETIKEKESISRYNKTENITIAIQKKADANTVALSKIIKQRLKGLKKEVPSDVKMEIVYDQSKFIKEAINDVANAAWQGGILSFLVLFLFLRDVASSLIITVSIPLCILVTFCFMYFRGITLNIISLGGLALGVGMVVDTSTVVIENVFRHKRAIADSVRATILGTDEVVAPITSSTLTTVVVFLPMIFVIGISGQIFKELAFTVIVALLASLAVSFTITPILIARAAESRNYGHLEEFAFISKIREKYKYLIGNFLAKKEKNLMVVFLVFVLSVLYFSYLAKKEFMPKVDQGQFIIKVNLTPGSTLGATDSIVKIIENELSRLEDVKDITVNIGSAKKETSKDVLKALAPHQGQIVVGLKNRRHNSTEDVIHILKDKLESQNLGSAELEFVLQESVLESALQQGAPIILEVKGNDINKLKEITGLIKQELKDVEGIYGMRDSSALPSPETKVRVQKDKAAAYGLSVSDVAFAAQTAIEGRVASKFKEAGEEIDIKVRLRNEDRKDLNKIRRLIVRTPTDMSLPISEVAYIAKGKGPTEIQHQDQQRVIFVSAYIYKRSLNSVADDLNKLISRINIPSNYSVTLTGENLKMRESFASLRFALILSIVLIYMIMASQFESFLQPFIIMFTIPLSVIGISAGLLLTNTSVSIMVMLGAIILGGIVVNNGIVLLDYVNELRKQGKSDYDAVVEASDVRFRPIMMTASTTVLGVLPLALTSPLQAPMAVVIMGGLTVSTFLSLVVLPAIFLAVVDFQKNRGKIPT